MLRGYYLPCDFYPKVLFVGEKTDVLVLLALLDEFIDHYRTHPVSLPFQQCNKMTLYGINLTLVPVMYEPKMTENIMPETSMGVFQVASGQFEWHLNAEMAQDYADQLHALFYQADASGSVIFEILQPMEIKIKVSINEFDDTYLQV